MTTKKVIRFMRKYSSLGREDGRAVYYYNFLRIDPVYMGVGRNSDYGPIGLGLTLTIG